MRNEEVNAIPANTVSRCTGSQSNSCRWSCKLAAVAVLLIATLADAFSLHAAGWVDGSATTQLSGQVELPRLVDLCAQRLGLNIEYDAGALRGSVTLRLGAGVSDEELWLLTNRVLARIC